MGNQSSALDILLNRMKETGTISTSPKSTTTGLSKTEEEERFRKWQAEAEAARAAAQQNLRNQQQANEWNSQGLLAKIGDVAKSVARGSAKNILATLAGTEAAVAGEGTVANDTYALLRSIMDRNDGVSAWDAFNSYGNLFIQRGGGVIPSALEKLFNDVGTLAGKVGINIDTENDIFSRWDDYLQEKKAAAEKNFYDKVGEVNNIYSAGRDYRDQQAQQEQTQKQIDYSKSPIAQNVYKYGTMVGSQLPTILEGLALAYMNPAAGAETIAGGLAPATTEGLLWLNEFNKASKLGQLGMLAANSIGSIATNPQYWTSVAMETGSAYNEAINANVDPSMASAYALSYGLLSGIIEVGGGDEAASNIENLPKKIRESLLKGEKGKAAWEYAKSIIGEIGEEEWQDMLSKTLQGSMLGQNVPVFSMEDENAIINPRRMGQTAIDTAITTALMGAGERAVIGGTQSLLDSRKYTGSAQTLLNAAKRAGGDTAKVSAIESALRRSGQINVGQARTLQSIIEDARQNPETRFSMDTGFVRDNLQAMFRSAGIDATDAELDVLANGYVSGTNSVSNYLRDVSNSFNYGSMGLTLEQARKSAEKAGSTLNPVQFEHAFKLGEAKSADTADVTTDEGKTKVRSYLSKLGNQAEAAAEVYEPTQDVQKYAEAMGKAVQLFAANGGDLKTIWNDAKTGKTMSSISYLTEKQIDTAQKLGAEFRTEQAESASRREAAFAEKRAKLDTLLKKGGNAAEYVDSTLATQRYISQLREDIRGTAEGLELARKSEPGIVNTAEYKAAVERLNGLRKDLQGATELQKRLKKGQEKAIGKKPGRKKGKVVYADKAGNASGIEYQAVDRSKLSKTQQATTRIAEAIADATGLEIRIISVPTTKTKGVGGEYIPGAGGVMYLNIDMTVDGKNMAAGSLFHELTHWIQEYSPAKYEELKRFVLQESQKNPEKFEDIFNARNRTSGYKTLSVDQVTDEMVANACMRVFEDPESVQRLAVQHKGLWETIRDFIVKFVDDVKAAFAEMDFSSDFNLMGESQLMVDSLEEMRDRFIDAFSTATENYQAEQAVGKENTATEGGVQMMNYSEKQTLQEYEAQTAVYDALDHADAGDDNLIKVSRMPKFIRDLSGIDGDFYVYRDHLYEDIKTEKEAREEGRFKKRGNYHGIGEEKAVQAIMSLENPAITINDTIGRGNPEIVMVLPVIGNKGTPLIAAFGFYKDQPINGKMNRKPHIVMSIYEKLEDYNGRGAAKKDLATLIDSAIDEGRILSYDKEISDGLPVTAQRPRLGSITASSLENNVSQFRNSVNEFKKDHKINYQTFEAESEQEERQIQRVQYSVFEEDPETLAWLNKQEKDGDVVHTYKSFLEIDGKLYPPMASMKKGPDGKWKMTKAMEVGRWEKSVGDPSKIEVDPKNGRGYFTLKKDDGSTVKAAYNPYQYSSNLMINDQFTGAYSRPGLVTYECIIPKSELTSGYRAEHAKDAVGVHSWKAGPVAGKLIKAKGTERQAYLSRWLKPVRKVPDAEVAQHYKELLDGTDIAVPSNVVPPSLLHALEDAGVRIEYDPRAPKVQLQRFDSTGAELTEDQEKFFADSKIRDDQGRLKVMYRGGNGDFTVFDRNKSSYSNLYGRGFYFTDSKSHAEQYGKARAFYLNIQNPVKEGTHDITRAQLRKFLQEVGENEDYGLENYGYGATVDSVLKSLRGKDDFGILQDVNATAIGDFVAAVELFNEVNGTSFDGIIAPTETVAFRAEQIKNTDNKTPTSDPDVRFQMISEVEESDKLIAVHNKTMSGLRRMIERGGVPFPSIAIKKAGSGHNHYGPVSIVFGRSRIDPEVNRANRIYGGDAWTPTEPSLDYDVDSDKVYKIREKIKTLIGPGPYNSLRLSGTLDADEIAKKLKDSGGDIFEALKSNVGLKYAYMRIMGTEPELPTREKPLDGFFKYKNNQLVELFDQLGEERIQKADYSDEEFRQAVADILNALQREELVAKMKERRKNGESTVSIERILNAYDKRPLYSRGDINVGVIQGALREYISDGRKLTQETDRSALEGILRDNTEVEKDPKYRKYIETTFQGVVRGSGIRNDKDVFTPSGNRRSFKQLHVPGTLDNIANVMSKMPETGGTAFGGSTLMGVGVKNYRTVEEARADRGRLYNGDYIDEEEFEGPKKALNDRLQELVEAAAKITSRDYAWEQRDSAREILLEAVRDSKTKAAMDRKLRNEAQWINYDPTLTDELWQLAEDTRNMKVPYFEAKLRRVVYPEEALAYIVEDTAEETDADLLKKMRDQGLNVLTYKAGDKEDRLRVLNSVEGAQFQRYDEQLDGQMAFFDVENSNMHPKMRERLAEAERLTEDIKAYFGSIPESMLSAEDIEGMLDFDVLSRDATSGDMLDPGAVVDELLATVSNGGEYRRRQAYRLAERLIQHMNAITEQTYIGGGNTDRVQDKAFAAWYSARHPSLYYPGYQPGDLFAKHANAFKGRDNIQKEKDYLHGLLESGKLMEPELSEARELLDRLNNPQPKEVFYQQWDDTYEDTSEESTGRELAYSRIQSENAILTNTVKELKKTVKSKDATIEKILKKLARAKKADADKLTRQIMREYSSKADLSEVTAAVKAVGDYYLQTPVEKLDEARVKELAREAATLIAQGAEETVETDNGQLREIRGSLEGQKVYIKPEFLGELDSYGGLKSVKNSLFGKRVYLSSEAGEGRISVDQLYEQLHADFGDYYFPEAGADNGPANEGEEIMIIADVLAASDSMTVNPFDAYMGEAVEAIANGIAFRVMNENVLRPLLPAEAEKAFDQLGAVTEENREIRKKLDAATTRGEVIKEELERLQQEGKDTKSELIELRDQVYDLTSALKKADQRYSALQAESEQRIAQVREEGTARVAEVRAKERERAAKEIQGLKDHYKEIQKKARDRREESAGTTKYRKQVQAKAKALYEMLMKNDDKKHVPEVLKKPVAEFLESIDFTSKRQLRGGEETNADKEFGARLRALERALSGQQDYIDGNSDVQQDLGGYVDISQENLQYLRDVIQMIDTALRENRDFTINSMNAQQLKQLSNFLSNLNAAIRGLNTFMANARFESVREAASKDIEFFESLGDASSGDLSGSAGFLKWLNGTPYYVFRRFGEGGQAIFDGLTAGWDQMAFDVQEIMAFTEKLYTTKEVTDWKNTVHKLTLEDGSEIEMTTAQIMELAMLLNREQALKHIEHGGIAIADFEVKKGARKEKKQNLRQYHLSYNDIQTITGLLSERQIQVAKALQQYMAKRGAEWGNEVSMRRFGYEFYTEGENYYPIKTMPTDRPMSDSDLPDNASMFRLLNLSSSKSLNPKASNALVVGNIFDTFADHMSDMAKLHGMGLPILDAIKWFNYKVKVDGDTEGTYKTRTIQAAMKQAYGGKALSYFRTLLRDINGTTEAGDRGTGIIGKFVSNFKIAAVGANLRVALLQPTSYVRATAVIKPQFLAGVVPSRAAYREAMKYSGTAVWKDMGFFDTDVARSMRGQIQHDDTAKDKLAEKAMWFAEMGDKLTWSMLWTAAKRQTAAENPDLKGEDLMQKTGELFRKTIYASQIMDSTLTRSELMRSKSTYDKALSAFMAEPTLSYNILLDAYSQYNLDSRKHGKAEAWARNSGKIGKAFAVYTSSAVFSAIVESLADALRDDDRDELLDKWLEAFLGEDTLNTEESFWTRAKSAWLKGNLGQDLSILGKLPFIKDIMSILQGYGASNMSTDGIESLLQVLDLFNGNVSKRITPWGKLYKYGMKPFSQLSGLPVANLARDVVAIWNNTVGNINKDLWLQKYDSIAMTDEMMAGFDAYVKDTGISAQQYKNILSKANTDGNTGVNQTEMGTYLVDALASGKLTEEQAQALWKSQWNKPNSKTFDKWRGIEEPKAPAPKSTASTETAKAPEPAVQDNKTLDHDGFKKAVPVYSDKKEAIYNAKPAGMTLDRYLELLQKADTSGNSSITQDEMGFKLRDAVKSGEITFEEADAIWRAQWNGARSKTLQSWAAKHP